MISGVSSNWGPRSHQALQGLSGSQAVEPVRKVAPRPGATELPREQARGKESAAVVSISDEARALAAQSVGNTEQEGGSAPSAEEQTEVKEMQKRDAEVRAHEQAHKAVGGQYAGAIHYDTRRGPDGASYAVGGHVNIDTSEVRDDPSATIVKMQQVVRAALAPADPSSADRAVAASANSQAADARRELAEKSRDVATDSGAAAPGTAAPGTAAPGAEAEEGASTQSTGAVRSNGAI